MACCILIFGIISILIFPLKAVAKLIGLKRSSSSPLMWQAEPFDEPNLDMKLSGNRFSLRARAKSFGYALSGLRHVIVHEHNARIHLIGALAVIGAALYLQLPKTDFAVLLLVIMAVCFAETVNTAFEHLCDVVSPEKNPSVKFAKDIAAGAVLICAISAVVIGGTIFWPYVSGAFNLHHGMH